MAVPVFFSGFLPAVWRHWEARFGTTFAVVLALIQYFVIAWSDPNRTPEWVKSFPPNIWFAFAILLLFWASYSAWGDERRRAIELQLDLNRERHNLAGCPQVILKHEESPLHAGFFVYNSGSGADAISVYLSRKETTENVLTSDVVHHVKAGEKSALMLHSESKTNGREEFGMEAWKRITEDAWIALHPPSASLQPAERANKVLDELLTHQILIHLELTYSDMSGKEYRSKAIVVWSELGDTVVEIRQGGIRKCDSLCS